MIPEFFNQIYTLIQIQTVAVKQKKNGEWEKNIHTTEWKKKKIVHLI